MDFCFRAWLLVSKSGSLVPWPAVVPVSKAARLGLVGYIC